jgi:hypothetical protein
MMLRSGEITFVTGARSRVRRAMAELSVKLQENEHKILFIDTINSINPHSSSYDKPDQERLFKNIYCVRTPKHYDLWARLLCSESFIRKHGIRVLLINSLSLVFEDAEEDEVNPVLRRILKTIKELTEKHGLVTVVGSSPAESVTVRQAEATIKANTNAYVQPTILLGEE